MVVDVAGALDGGTEPLRDANEHIVDRHVCGDAAARAQPVLHGQDDGVVLQDESCCYGGGAGI